MTHTLFSFTWWFAFLNQVWLWHVATILLGWLVFPLLAPLLRPLPDRGYAVARIFGAFLLNYVNWLLCHRVMKFSPLSLGVSLGLLGTLSLGSLAFGWRGMRDFLRLRWKWILSAEVLAAGLFLILVNIRSSCADINYRSALHGSEKLGNMMLLSSLWRAEHFPTEDAWFCIQRPADAKEKPAWINYYYGGHLQWATLARLTGKKPDVAFNLALATLFSWVGMGAYGLVLNLTRRRRVALLAAALLVFGGNIEAVEQLFKMIQTHRQIRQSETPSSSAAEQKEHAQPKDFHWREFMTAGHFDLWSSSRVILRGGPEFGEARGLTVNEFPYFSFILGDLHAHSSALPLSLALLHILLALYWRKEESAWTWFDAGLFPPGMLALMCMLVGGLYWYNSWEAVPLALLLTALFFWDRGDLRAKPFAAPIGAAVMLVALFGLGIFVFFALFSLNLDSPWIEGAGWRERLKSARDLLEMRPWRLSTRLNELGLFWGLIWTPLALVLTPKAWSAISTIRSGQLKGFVISLVVFLVALLAMYGGGFALPVCAALTAISAIAVWREEGSEAERFAQRLAFAGFLMVLFAEAFYINDAMGDLYERYNTVFKLYYPAWAELTIAAIVLSWAWMRRTKQKGGSRLARMAAAACVAALIAMSMVYPYMATWARTDGFFSLDRDAKGAYPGVRASEAMRRRTLDGLDHLDDPSGAPDDLKAIRWLNAHITDRPHILEAERPVKEATGHASSAYSQAGRVAAYTGLPTVIGWDNHEAQWRGRAKHWPDIVARQAAARKIFETEDLAEATVLLSNFAISYVFVGQLEREIYSEAQLSKFAKLGGEIFRSGKTSVYKINPAIALALLQNMEAPNER